MSWKKLKKIFYVIVEKEKANKTYSQEWRDFTNLALVIEKNPPPAVSAIHFSLQQIEKKLNKKEIAILDHGCGSGLTLIYLSVIGYTNVHGVNVNDSVEHMNSILRKKFKFYGKRVFTTDGKKVPFEDEKFDFIISAQVAEHLRDDEVNMYYSEEGRVLKKNGLAYHELPHKLMLYDSHSRFWLIHFFPYFCKPLLYGIFMSIRKKRNLLLKGGEYALHFSKEFLILRTPNFHKKMLDTHIGPYEDLTVKRLARKDDFSSYDHDGPLKLRVIMQKIFLLPILGKIFIYIFKNFFILQTLSKKKLLDAKS
tara:strand:- start:304 stop:1230 length:927 start_codon:yes stop_codon:yes gene_type:complete